MNIKLTAVALLSMMVAGQARAAILTDAEATFLEQLATAAAVLEQRCTGYEANGAGGVQLGARALGSPDAAMALINAFDAAIKAHDGNDYDPDKFRPEVSEAAGKTFKRVRSELIEDPERACAAYGDSGAAVGLLRRY
ncbi:hypothetical protein FBZ93_105258 [Bradyrhizobium macuxiense]|uniref:Uncharacterized protein n=1 Tax=Bradyrhizobium macuxiense TaxID=1755647 RepID=A0A560M466_9BRAD|nr:hypothetical protein [Bradyrhizobium macuxiense]TWC00461.1 hypothetical protein FBZ93_105258 [Bradyrhizobium macuxiense]